MMFCLLAAVGMADSPFKNHKGDTFKDIGIKKLAEMLNESLRRPSLKNKEIGILTFTNLNNLEEADPIGRHLQARLAHALFDLGFRVIEIRMGKGIRFEPMLGEINLSREIKEKLKRSEFPEIQSLIVGVYLDAGDYIYVNSRLVELSNSTVRASGEIKIRKGRYLSKLLNMEDDSYFSSKHGEVYERWPVKGFEKK